MTEAGSHSLSRDQVVFSRPGLMEVLWRADLRAVCVIWYTDYLDSQGVRDGMAAALAFARIHKVRNWLADLAPSRLPLDPADAAWAASEEVNAAFRQTSLRRMALRPPVSGAKEAPGWLDSWAEHVERNYGPGFQALVSDQMEQITAFFRMEDGDDPVQAGPEGETMKDLLPDADIQRTRIDLAAAFRLAAREGWNEGVANHFSAAVSPDGRKFLINPRWRHFSLIEASDLLLLDADDPETMDRPDAPDPSAWSIHAALHRMVPQARVALHLHPPYATALAGLKDPTIKPIDQVTARFFNRLGYDLSFGGIASGAAEGERIARSFGNHAAVLMGNHGVTTVADSVAEAFDAMYHLERAARTMVLAYATGQPLGIMPDELAEATAREWEAYKGAEFAHFAEMKRILNREEPGYRN